MPTDPCWDCGDRIRFTVPNDNFKQVLLEVGFEDGPWRYLEIDYPFVLLQDLGEEEGKQQQTLGERGDRLGYRPDTDQWGVKHDVPAS